MEGAAISGADTLAFKAKQFIQQLPGRRQSLGGSVPDDAWHRITAVAHGASQPIWGRNATPEQIQHLWDNGLTEPQQIHDAYGAMPHPHAQGLSVAEYGQWSQAYDTLQKHK